jgi:hypothetical protein
LVLELEIQFNEGYVRPFPGRPELAWPTNIVLAEYKAIQKYRKISFDILRELGRPEFVAVHQLIHRERLLKPNSIRHIVNAYCFQYGDWREETFSDFASQAGLQFEVTDLGFGDTGFDSIMRYRMAPLDVDITTVTSVGVMRLTPRQMWQMCLTL